MVVTLNRDAYCPIINSRDFVRILLVYPYVPYPLTRGTFHRVFNLARELGQRHEVDLFCLDDAKSQAQRSVFETFARRVHTSSRSPIRIAGHRDRSCHEK